MYPLRFEPVFRNYIWGGRRLPRDWNKSVSENGPVAESWEVVDHDQGQSRVRFGNLAGKTLGELMRSSGPELVGAQVWNDINGAAIPVSLRGRFPLLFKFLDACQNLSVQVHPNDEQAAKLSPPDLGKTEAWLVLDAEPGSRIYAGLKDGIDRIQFERALQQGAAEECLHWLEPSPGDCVLIPAGTVHAIGGGLLIAEIQQASNTTYRLFDWNRVDVNGKPRPLHLEPGLDAVDFSAGPISIQDKTNGADSATIELVRCEKFVVNSRKVTGPAHWGKTPGFRILSVLSGSVAVKGDPAPQPIPAGESVLIPAGYDLELESAETADVIEILPPDA